MGNENQEVTEVVENVEQVTNVSETEANEVEFTDTSVDTSENTEEVKSQEKVYTQVEIDRMIQKRLDREKRQFEKELSKYQGLAKTLQVGMGESDIDSLKTKMQAFYKEQGVEIPEEKPFTNERDEIILAKADAEEIIELGEKEMEAEANRIASIPREKRSLRETTMFNTLCDKLVEIKKVQELERKGIDKSILSNEDFKKFADQFNSSTPIAKIHELYLKTQEQVIEKPKSTGSVKNTVDNTAKEQKNEALLRKAFGLK